MSELLGQLGIDWRLLLSQAVNFFLLLAILRIFVYKPLLKLLHDRQARIEEGLTKADEADRRLGEVDIIGKGKIKEAEMHALTILKKVEGEAKDLEAKMMVDMKRKEAEELRSKETLLRTKEEESMRNMEKEAVTFVRKAIAKTVELSPEQIDDALIARAVREMSSRDVKQGT